ncbi:putative protein TFG [Trichinella spiralis]|uniref:putative protein TFG n=1 Tax=Trichinella spiralis TaxID=6334 RepID=UPI0001EFF03D|nr:putative protein TFG [Trichinella spiralis]
MATVRNLSFINFSNFDSLPQMERVGGTFTVSGRCDKWKSNNKLIRRQLRITARKQICAYAHIHTADVVLCYGAAFSRPVGCSNMKRMTTTSCAMDVSPWQASIIKL